MAEKEEGRDRPARKPGRPRKRTAGATREVTVALAEETARRLHRKAYDDKCTKSEIAEKAISAYLTGYVSPRLPGSPGEDATAA